ncbi:hypothetical protein, conserved [Trypanosoma brucei gambiense DAL972]|uniref:Uncharacterized protein n=1 Tax=Trypanosoma brucei gambiense (strain MHOM/CI/86/DAL972) TaxID=679716 RepID=D0A5P4_TRYB9|nr:hypothetical protein, conserved [Trypanosoma brucei gambiense DAL972]CBH16995.1 hypothetical protein, conserved [Trypanosoma brucei gambiense DAL972]|eukprot:XP_011779259.1 hypothetical protein, conserved [Trypanosoma brucei gambiense DAL972]
MSGYGESMHSLREPVSPCPRRRSLGSTPLERQRSYSRGGMVGSPVPDDMSFTLSPLPYFPKRTRSVTFEESDEAPVREERPYYSWDDRHGLSDKRGFDDNGAAVAVRDGGEECHYARSGAAGRREEGDQRYRPFVVAGTTFKIPRSRSQSRQHREAEEKLAMSTFSYPEIRKVEDFCTQLLRPLEENEPPQREGYRGAHTNEGVNAGNDAGQPPEITPIRKAKATLKSGLKTDYVSRANCDLQRTVADHLPRRRGRSNKREASRPKEEESEEEGYSMEASVAPHEAKQKTTRCVTTATPQCGVGVGGASRRRTRCESVEGGVVHSTTQKCIHVIDIHNAEEEIKSLPTEITATVSCVVKGLLDDLSNQSFPIIIKPCKSGGLKQVEVHLVDGMGDEEHGDWMPQRVVASAPQNRKRAPQKRAAERSVPSVSCKKESSATPLVAPEVVPVAKRSLPRPAAPPLIDELNGGEEPVLLRRSGTMQKRPARSVSYISVDTDDMTEANETSATVRRPQSAPKSTTTTTRRCRKASATAVEAPTCHPPLSNVTHSSPIPPDPFLATEEDLESIVEEPVTLRRNGHFNKPTSDWNSFANDDSDVLDNFLVKFVPENAGLMLARANICTRKGRRKTRGAALSLPPSIGGRTR